jgi:hypothetical protein
MMGSRRQVEHGLQLRMNYIASHNRMIIYCLNGRHPRQEYDFLWGFHAPRLSTSALCECSIFVAVAALVRAFALSGTPVKKTGAPPGRYNEVPCAHVAARIVRFALMSIVFLLDKPHDQPQL